MDAGSPDDTKSAREPHVQTSDGHGQKQFAAPTTARDEYTDERALWDWKSRYSSDARHGIACEAWALGIGLFLVVSLAALFLSLSGQRLQIPFDYGSNTTNAGVSINVEFRVLAIFFAGWVGGTTFSIKWLVHAVATGRWHLDRRYWRLLVPGLGGVYACAVLTLFDAGVIGGGQPLSDPRPIAVAAAFAFLIGYFSDGVSGLPIKYCECGFWHSGKEMMSDLVFSADMQEWTWSEALSAKASYGTERCNASGYSEALDFAIRAYTR